MEDCSFICADMSLLFDKRVRTHHDGCAGIRLLILAVALEAIRLGL